MGSKLSASSETMNIEDILKYKFHQPFAVEDEINGLCFNGVYLPEEIVTLILSLISPDQILRASLVCKRWCNIIKSTTFWFRLYEETQGKHPEKLPWYVFYGFFTNLLDHNLLKNGNGQERFNYWNIIENGGEQFIVEETPAGADPLPLDVPDFNGHKCCFATSYQRCVKRQEITLLQNKLLAYIVNKFKPDIYLSEWVAGRFDCGCKYLLTCLLRHKKNIVYDKSSPEFRVEQWQGKEWTKVKIY